MPAHYVHNAFTAHPRQRLPRKSSAHRIACLALYRALLEQCPRIPLPDDIPPPGPVDPIKHLIRKRFKRDVVISSPRLAVEALKVGYAAEQLLRAAGDGNAPALSKVYTLVRLQHQQSEHSRQVCQPAPPRKPQIRVWPYPSAPKLIDVRPLPFEQLTGLRRVPTLTQASDYPFFRIRKPQSPYLSRVLRDKIAQKDKRFTRVYALDRDVEDGKEEAEWEDIVMEQLQKEGGGNKEWRKGQGRDWGKDDGSWVVESVRARHAIMGDLHNDLRRASWMGERLTEIWEKEKELWRQERGERNHAKNVARKERRLLKEKGEAGSQAERVDAEVEGQKLYRPIRHK